MLVNLFPEEDLRVGHFSQASLSNSEEQTHHQSIFSPLLNHVLPEQPTPGRVPEEYLTPLLHLNPSKQHSQTNVCMAEMK